MWGVCLSGPSHSPQYLLDKMQTLLLSSGVGGLGSPTSSFVPLWLRGSGQFVSKPQLFHLQNGIEGLRED